MEAQVAAEMRRYVVETWLGGDGRGLYPETDLQEAGLLDSFAMLALVGHLGDAFEVGRRTSTARRSGASAPSPGWWWRGWASARARRRGGPDTVATPQH
jgi:hypothetical protein